MPDTIIDPILDMVRAGKMTPAEGLAAVIATASNDTLRPGWKELTIAILTLAAMVAAPVLCAAGNPTAVAIGTGLGAVGATIVGAQFIRSRTAQKRDANGTRARMLEAAASAFAGPAAPPPDPGAPAVDAIRRLASEVTK